MRIDRGPSQHRRRRRRGAQLAEVALVLPIMFMFVMGTITISMGIYYYQQVAALAREGARYASVRGSQYASVAGNTAATQATIQSNAIAPMAVGLASGNLSSTANWVGNNTPANAPGNIVQVTVSYNWTPVMYIHGTLTLSSTSKMVISY